MSTNRKSLKVVALIYLVGAIASVVAGILMFTGGNNSDNPLIALGSYFLAAVMLLNAIAGFVGGALGVRAANNPAKAGAAFVWGIICLVVMAALFIYTLVTSGIDWQLLCSAVMNGLYFYLAYCVRKEGQDRLS